MKEKIMHITVDEKQYPLMVSLNVIAWAQEKYGSIEAWQNLMSPHNAELEEQIEKLTKELNDAIQEHGESSDEAKTLLRQWSELTKARPEPDIAVIRDSFTEMVNEGIDYENELENTSRPFLSNKQVGRIITAYGIQNATTAIKTATVNSIKTDEETKNE